MSVSHFHSKEQEQNARQRYIKCACNAGESLMYGNGSRIINVSLGTLNALRLLLCSHIQLDVLKDILWSERSAAFSCAPTEY